MLNVNHFNATFFTRINQENDTHGIGEKIEIHYN